jgi:hypothetical protein
MSLIGPDFLETSGTSQTKPPKLSEDGSAGKRNLAERRRLAAERRAGRTLSRQPSMVTT